MGARWVTAKSKVAGPNREGSARGEEEGTRSTLGSGQQAQTRKEIEREAIGDGPQAGRKIRLKRVDREKNKAG